VDQADPTQNRRTRRSPVLLTARLETAGGEAVQVKLRNLSESGALVEALVEGGELPEEGSAAVFERDGFRVKCTLVWVEGRYAGVAFARALKPQDVLRQISRPKPKAQVDIRRPGLACRPLTNYERKMLETWMTASPSLGD